MANGVQGQVQNPTDSTVDAGASVGSTSVGVAAGDIGEKKSLFKKWWVWLIIVVVVILVGWGIWAMIK